MSKFKENQFVTPKQSCFSILVPEFQEPQRTWYGRIAYLLFHQATEEQINYLLDPYPEDLKIVLDATREFSSYVIEDTTVKEGILYVNITLGGIKPEYRKTSTPRSIADDMLVRFRRQWQLTRCGNYCFAPFVSVLNARKLILGFPISIYGLRTLAKIQRTQKQLARIETAEKIQQEERVQKALSNFQKRNK